MILNAKPPALLESINSGSESLDVDYSRGRRVLEPSMRAKSWLTVRKRTWHADINGKEIAPITGERGFYSEWQVIVRDNPNLLTNTGRDYLINTDYINADNLGGTHNPANNVGLTQDNAAASASDTALASEIVAADLARVQFGTRTHTNGTGNNAWSLVQTFTAANVYTTNGGVQKAGLFSVATAPVSGTMVHENTFTPVPLQVNDQLQLSWTGSLG